jgi:hypothetical protein
MSKLRDRLAHTIAKSMLDNPEIIDMLRESFLKQQKEIKLALIDRKSGKAIGGLPSDKKLKEKFTRAMSHESYKMADEILKTIGEK